MLRFHWNLLKLFFAQRLKGEFSLISTAVRILFGCHAHVRVSMECPGSRTRWDMLTKT